MASSWLTRRRFFWPAAAILTIGLSGLTGCQLIAVWFAPDPVVEAEYKLTKAPLLVLVDEPTHGAAEPDVRHHLASELIGKLKKNEVNGQIVPDDEVRRIRRDRPTSAEWPESRIGKLVHAQQVLHVQMEPYVVSRDTMDPTAHSKLSATVRVLDVDTGELLWPMEGAGRRIVFELEVRDIHTSDLDWQMKRDLAKGLADQIAKLFYRHTITDVEAFRRGAREGRLW